MNRYATIGIAFLIFLTACSSDTGSKQTSIQTAEPTSIPQIIQQQSENSSKVPEPDKAQDEDTQDEDKNREEELQFTEDLKAYLYENFGGAGNPEFATSWYKYIDDIKVNVYEDELEVTVYTSIYPDDEGKEYAEKFFPPIWGWANNATDPKNVTFVKVLGQNNRILASQTNPIN